MEDFKVVIAGGRDFNDFSKLCNNMDNLLRERAKINSIVIISGGARGTDTLGERYAHLRGFRLIKMKADWNKHGKSAGFIRNKEMLHLADGVVCFWDSKSRGTKHMIGITKGSLIPLRIIFY